MAGAFVLVVGPSGAGKDTVLRLARERLDGDPRFLFPRRLITRPPDPWEDHEPIDWPSFERGETEGLFALSWRAHGLGYALPGSALAAVRSGRVAACNVSRERVEPARQSLPHVVVVEVTASPETLAARIETRGRETGPEAQWRVVRASQVPCRADHVIPNEGPPQEAAERMIRLLAEVALSVGAKVAV